MVCIATMVASKGRRLWLWFGLILMFFCIFKTSSRGSWIALIGSLVLCSLFGQRKMRRYIGTLAVIAVLAMVVRPGAWETIQNDYLATTETTLPKASPIFTAMNCTDWCWKKSVNHLIASSGDMVLSLLLTYT